MLASGAGFLQGLAGTVPFDRSQRRRRGCPAGPNTFLRVLCGDIHRGLPRVGSRGLSGQDDHGGSCRGRAQLWFTLLLILLFAAPLLSASDCISIQDARQHVGESKCVTGKVLRVRVGTRGVHFIEFCEDQMACPFSVVVFPSDLKDVGDVRRLQGRSIEIHGAVKLYDGRAEIILKRIGQLTGGAAMIPPLPKNYDVENRGHYSAGRLRPPKKLKPAKPNPSATGTYGDVESDDPFR